jgi:hypothetical protein
MNRNVAVLVEMSALLAPFWRTFVATNLEVRSPILVWLRAGWKSWLSRRNIN